MTRLLATTRTRIDESESLRLVLLWGISFALGLTFIALLIADEAHAAGV